MDDIIIEPLADHPREAFSCELKTIDSFFQKHAAAKHEAYAVRVFVARRLEDPTPLGFYALTTMTFKPGMSEEADEKFGRFEAIPSIYLTMIGRDKNAPKGIGARLMLDAFERALEVRENVGVYALTLHAYNEKVREYYLQYGFQQFADPAQDSGKQKEYPAMYIPLSTVAAAYRAA
jgi:hypothetical protein